MQYLGIIGNVACSLSLYTQQGLHKEPWIDNILKTGRYKKMYTSSRQLPQPIFRFRLNHVRRWGQSLDRTWCLAQRER